MEKSLLGGPNSARFVFIAASPLELENVRSELKSYGNQGGWYWQPYYPSTATCAGKVAQLAATQLDFRYSELDVGDDLLKDLKEAEERNEVVVLLTDPWTILVPRYATLMQEYDKVTLVNCSVLVPWNDDDPETKKQRNTLRLTLSKVLPRKHIVKPPAHEWDGIDSLTDLDSKIGEVLEKLRMMVLQLGQAGRKAESADLSERARLAGVPIEDKPTLVTPGSEVG